MEDIVQTNIAYTYAVMQNDIRRLKERYPFLRTGNIGYSVLGKPIPYVRIGTGQKEVMYNGSFHANEYIVTIVLMKYIEDFCKAYSQNTNIFGYNARNIYNNTTIYIVPMVNPDGVDLVTGAVQPNSRIYQNYQYIARNFPAIPFPSGWKANFNGVDLKNFQPFCKVL